MAKMNIVNWPRLTGTCPKCGRRTNEGSRFCSACGARFPQQNEATGEGAQPVDAAPTPQVTQHSTAPMQKTMGQKPERAVHEGLDWRIVLLAALVTALVTLILRRFM